MTPPRQPWDELHLAENPAVELLQALGYIYVTPETLEADRETFREVVLVKRLATALKKLNPWLTDDNVRKAIKAVTGIQGSSLIEINEKVYTALTYGTSLEQDRGDGKKGQTVRYFDFDHPERNDLVVTRQYKVKGTKKHIIPDVVVFVNGIPLVVIECKSPTSGGDWKHEACEQFDRYQENNDRWNEQGAPRLFDTAQLLVATCGQSALYGTVLTPQRFFAEWKQPWPKTVAQVEAALGRKPTAQDVLLAGMLDPANLLDIVRNFMVFERDPSTGKTVKKVCRYQQFGAVNKAITRAGKAKKPTDRGGVVWHTQGSGKSLTMLWLALKLRRDPRHDNPTLVIVTDRKDLDDQITGTFHNCGFQNPERADSVRDLKRLLTGPTGKTVLTTVQKFQELSEGNSGVGIYTSASNVFVFVDEAHRTQYKSLAANMRKALPNAAFFGFTGTPIDKRDRSTLTTFGDYIDTYTIEQAVADGATVPIFYESRLPDLRIIGSNLDALFDRVFADRTEEEREAIKARYATDLVVAGAPKRIETICLDLVEHYTRFIRPNGFKAQVVACTREAAVTYKEALDRLNAPQSAILMSGTNDDEAHLASHHTSEEDRKAAVKRFLKADDPLSILIVCDMLLTGFDAPIEQVMYLDSPLREHTLLQAIARVNRTADKKTYGLIVDYWGVSEALQEALAIFSPSDIKGAMEPKVDELPRLQARHAAAMQFFDKVKNKNDLEACVAVLEPEDIRARFNQSFRRFAQSLDMVLPDPAGLPYVRDLKWLGKIRGAAAARFRDGKLDVSDCGGKVRKLIEEAIVADGIQILVQRVGLFTKDFDDKLAKLKSTEARASEMEHAIRDEIHVKLDEDPAFFTSLREKLEQIIEDHKAKRIDDAKQLELFQVLITEMSEKGKAAQQLGLSETGFAIYGVLSEPDLLWVAERGGQGPVKDLAATLEADLDPHVGIVDWARKDDVQREMRKVIKRRLKEAGVPGAKRDGLASAIVDLMKARRGR
jgi:type I restriction enzyme R subunit